MQELRNDDAQVGEQVLALATTLGKKRFGYRLRAAYALGSLAHGGFAPLVSDVDLAFMLADPLLPGDAAEIDALVADVKAAGLPLGDRLSVFWGSRASLLQPGDAGRFPPLDRLDLVLSGRLLGGEDDRAGLPMPSRDELVIAAVEFALKMFDKPEVMEKLRDARALVASGPRPLTKRVLFPVRFLYTAATGEIGRNEGAVAYYVAHATGPTAELAKQALAWRVTPPENDARTIALVEAGLRPLYLAFIDDHVPRMQALGRPGLATQLRDWGRRIAA